MGVFVAGPLNSSDVVKGDDWGIHLNDSSKDGYFDATDTRHHYCRRIVVVTSKTGSAWSCQPRPQISEQISLGCSVYMHQAAKVAK